MKYSTSKRLALKDLTSGRKRESFFETVGKRLQRGTRGPLLLLAGGSAPVDLAVRNAQSLLRLDQSPSHWSHAAFILEWKGGDWKNAIGVEVRIDPVDVMQQVPERNGATVFRLKDYNQSRWENLAIFHIRPNIDRSSKKKERAAVVPDLGAAVREAVRQPCLERSRYRLWDWLAPWSAFCRAPALEQNPISRGIPHPGAAFCEYALEAAGVDLTPNSTEPSACPETIWGAFLYWHEAFKNQIGTVEAWVWLKQRERCWRKPLLPQFPDGFVG